MKRIVLCPNVARDEGLAFTRRVMRLLEEAGYETVVSPIYGDAGDIPSVALSAALERAELLVSLGGDGTILHLAPLIKESDVPLVGVNLGHKGFLTELGRDDYEKLLDAAAGRYEIVPRMMLDVELVRDGQVIFSDTAINEAQVSGVVQNVRLSVMGDGERILTFSGDGVIVASPTGSTAYSCSAGGPLVEPSTENIILTPICAHMLAARSFVLAPERTVTVIPLDIEEKRCILTADGRGMLDLRSGDQVVVRRSVHKLYFADLGTKSFYEAAFEKLGERE